MAKRINDNSEQCVPTPKGAGDNNGARKTKDFDKFLSDVAKRFGKDAIMVGNKQLDLGLTFLSSGSITLDSILGGGYPYGRIVEVYGDNSSGKTTLALIAIANAQKQGKRCAFVDMEQTLSIDNARLLGVDTDSLLVAQPSNGAEALNLIEEIIDNDNSDVELIVLDSVGALTTEQETESDIGASQMASVARLMSQALKKLNPLLNKNKKILFCINQVRASLELYGAKEVTMGGNALKFYASQRISVKRPLNPDIKDSLGEAIGHTVKFKIVKNKVANPHKEAHIPLYYGKGFSKEEEIINIAVNYKIINKSGSWYSYGEGKDTTKLGQGLENVKATLIENVDLYEELVKKVESVIYNTDKKKVVSAEDIPDDIVDNI